MDEWAPTRVRQSGAITFRLSRVESLIRGLVGSQAAILVIVSFTAPDGSGGNGAHIDVARLVVFLLRLYVVVSLVGLAIGYVVSRRKTVEITPEGFSMGGKRIAWVDVPGIDVKRSPLGSECVKAGRHRFPAPINSRLRPNPRFDQDAALITSYWKTGQMARTQ